jgi:hypothetical protein
MTAAAKQQHEDDYDQDQFHENSPLTMPAYLPRIASLIPPTALCNLDVR